MNLQESKFHGLDKEGNFDSWKFKPPYLVGPQDATGFEIESSCCPYCGSSGLCALVFSLLVFSL